MKEKSHTRQQMYTPLLRRLSKEYSLILFNYQLTNHVAPAVLQVTDSQSYLAQWDPLNRDISFSQELLNNFRWNEVVEALKHEIAHQIVDEYFEKTSKNKQPPHGKLFQKTCEMISVASWARGPRIHTNAAAPSLSELLKDHESPIEQKIAKLLRLSESDNEHEAALALEKAKALRDKFSISENDSHSYNTYLQNIHYIALATGNKRRQAFHSMLANLLITHFGVQGIFTKAYEAKTDCNLVELELIGQPKDLLMAEYVYHYLIKTCDHLWLKHKQTLIDRHIKLASMRVAKNSFINGVLRGFGEKLSTKKLSPPTMQKNTEALLKQEDQLTAALNDYFKKRYPRTQNVVSRRRLDKTQYKAGKKQGKRLSLNAPMTNSEKSIKLIQ